MKFVLGILFCSIALNIYFIAASYQRSRVVSVADGDSIQLADGRRVRLLGIDAPEIGRCLADEAKNKLRELVLGKHVRLKDTLTDDYGRVLAIVIVGYNTIVNQEMLAAGLAKNTYAVPAFKQTSDEAKAKKLGIFSTECRSEPTGDCTIKGNVRDGQKTYHLTSCDNYNQGIIDEAYGDHWFCTEKEAVAAGFTKAAGCRE